MSFGIGASGWDTMRGFSQKRAFGIASGMAQASGMRAALFGTDPMVDPSGAIFGQGVTSATGLLGLTAEFSAAKSTISMARTAAVRPRAEAFNKVDLYV